MSTFGRLHFESLVFTKYLHTEMVDVTGLIRPISKNNLQLNHNYQRHPKWAFSLSNHAISSVGNARQWSAGKRQRSAKEWATFWATRLGAFQGSLTPSLTQSYITHFEFTTGPQQKPGGLWHDTLEAG